MPYTPQWTESAGVCSCFESRRGPARPLIGIPLSAMSRSDIERVLRNWIDQAITPDGAFADGTDRARWVADNFIAWWRKQVDDSLGSAESAARRLREELERLGTPTEFGEALHELTHVQDALGDLRQDLGLSDDSTNGG